MKKKLLALAVGAAVAMPVVAMADVSIYGRAHVSVDYLDTKVDDGGVEEDYSKVNMSSNSSRLGFKGSRDFDGLTAMFQVEQEITFNQGTGSWAGRDTFVGLKTNELGMLRAGQFDTPFKRARGPANLFGDQVGDMRNLTRVGDARFDERTPNTLHYQTPTFAGGAQFNLAYSLHEGNTSGLDDDSAVSTSVTFKDDLLDLALAYEAFKSGNRKGDAVRFAGGIKVTEDLKVVAFYQTVSHDADSDQDADTYGVGGEFRATPKTYLKAMYLMRDADADERDSDMAVVGVEHRIDRALRVYANYAVVSNDDNAGLTPWNQARTTGNSPAGTSVIGGESANALSLGLRYDF